MGFQNGQRLRPCGGSGVSLRRTRRFITDFALDGDVGRPVFALLPQREDVLAMDQCQLEDLGGLDRPCSRGSG